MKKEIKYCPNHPEATVLCKGLCRKCYEKQLIDNNPNYKLRQQENSRKWHEKNKIYKAQYDKDYRKKVGPNTEKRYFSFISRKYNFSEEEYILLKENCNNKCMICGKNPYKGKRLHLDHDHVTGKIRGLLCTRCNWYLGTIEKNPEILKKINVYLYGK